MNILPSIKLLVLVCLTHLGESNSNVLDSLIDESYDGRVRPDSQGYPTEIRVCVRIDSVDNLDVENHVVSLTLDIVEVWNDPRLDGRSGEEIEIHGSNGTFKVMSDKVAIDDTGRVWMTSLYFGNIKGSPVESRVVKVDGNLGQVTKMTKVSMNVGCSMEFFYFPFDKQSCEFTISSLEYSKNQVLFLWKEEEAKGLSFSKHLPHAQLYTLKGFAVSNETSDGILGEHSELAVKLLFVRMKARSFSFFYFPPLALCVTAFVSLWMDVSPLPIVISFIAFITGILHYILVENHLPTYPEMGMYDHYVFVCINLILNSVIVNIIMYGFLNPTNRPRKTSIVGRTSNGKMEMKTFNGIDSSGGSEESNHESPKSSSPDDDIYKMSKFKQAVYFKGCKPAKYQLPIMFGVINVIYWCWIVIATLPFPSGFHRVP